MLVTVGIIAYNEEKDIGDLLSNLLCQTYPHDQIEIILVDGKSEDKTKEIMIDFQEANKEFFHSISVLDNEKRIQSAGWNIVIDNSKGDCIIRIDAHAVIPDDFVEKNVSCILLGEDVCGGRRTNIINGNNAKKKLLLFCETAMFGSGMAKYRTATKKEYVKSVAHACYKKEVFEKAGLFDERLLRSEDNEMHYRIRKSGFKICLDPEIQSYYLTRPTWKSMLKQKYGNGLWIGKTTREMTFKIFSLYHFIPFVFVMALLFSAILAVGAIFVPQLWWIFCLPLIAIGLAYKSILLLSTLAYLLNKEVDKKIFFAVPIIISSLHFAYGFGTLIGFLEGLRREYEN